MRGAISFQDKIKTAQNRLHYLISNNNAKMPTTQSSSAERICYIVTLEHNVESKEANRIFALCLFVCLPMRHTCMLQTNIYRILIVQPSQSQSCNITTKTTAKTVVGNDLCCLCHCWLSHFLARSCVHSRTRRAMSLNAHQNVHVHSILQLHSEGKKLTVEQNWTEMANSEIKLHGRV